MGRHYSNKKVLVIPGFVQLIGVQILMIATPIGIFLAAALYLLMWYPI